MAKVEVVVKEKEVRSDPVTAAVRKAALLGMGAAALAQEQADELMQRLVERGETVQRDSRRMAREMWGRRQSRAGRARAQFEKKVEEIAGGMNLPTRSDIEDLNAKITALTAKIDELQRRERGGTQ